MARGADDLAEDRHCLGEHPSPLYSRGRVTIRKMTAPSLTPPVYVTPPTVLPPPPSSFPCRLLYRDRPPSSVLVSVIPSGGTTSVLSTASSAF